MRPGRIAANIAKLPGVPVLSCRDQKAGQDAFSCETARRLRHIIEDAKAQQGLAVIGHINRAINLEIKAVPQNVWLSPLEAFSGAGDLLQKRSLGNDCVIHA